MGLYVQLYLEPIVVGKWVVICVSGSVGVYFCLHGAMFVWWAYVQLYLESIFVGKWAVIFVCVDCIEKIQWLYHSMADDDLTTILVPKNARISVSTGKW